MTESSRRRQRHRRSGLVVLLSMALTVGALGGSAYAVPGDGLSRQVDLPDLPDRKPLGQDKQAEKDLTTADEVPVVPYEPTAVTPWKQGTGTVDLGGAKPGDTVPVADLPIAIGVPEGADPAPLAGKWKVDLAGYDASQKAELAGMIMQITPPATADPEAKVALTVDTTAFNDLYGPQAADRFGLTTLPECVLTSPDSGDCASGAEYSVDTDGRAQGAGTAAERLTSRTEVVPVAAAPTRSPVAKNAPNRRVVKGTVSVATLIGPEAVAAWTPPAPPVEKKDDAAKAEETKPGESEAKGDKDAKTAAEDAARAAEEAAAKAASARPVSFVKPQREAPAAPRAGPTTLGVLDTGASATGDFTATPLSSSGSWSAGASSGAFTYGYQLQIPETSGGLIPKVGLNYSSQTADGRTSAANNQASWVGDGWDYNAGSITRTYASCREDSQKPGSNNKTHKTADLCFGSENATMTLGGATVELVYDAAKKTWTTANGDGSRIELLKDTSLGNGDADGEYWVVTTKDGTRYHFGRHKLPGWTSGKPTTNSVLTVPVYGNHPGEPCYKAGNWAGSFCTQGWRWNLDYVEDIHGNAMSLWWQKETNNYARNFNFKAPVSYDRGGWLTHIEYGQRKDNLFTVQAPARVDFTVAERCFAEDGVDCTEANFTSKDPGKYRIWYDTPADLQCKGGKEKCWNAGPAFFTRKRLAKVTTSIQRVQGLPVRHKVDEYTLEHSFPVLKTGPNTALWLESINRTGYGPKGTADDKATLNPIRFEHNLHDMPNRVQRGANDPTPGFSRLRIGRVINEYGGETVVNYRAAQGQCATGEGLPGKKDTAALKANNRLCYPVYWHPDPEAEEIDWFHKYVVESIEELPNVDGAYANRTEYQYRDAAWRLAQQEFTKKSKRTYSHFAGFASTAVITGSDSPEIGAKKTKAVTRYFQGLGDDVSVKDIAGNEIAKDREPFAGRVAEELTYTSADKADTDWNTRSVTYPAAQELAKRVRDDGLTDLKAWRITEPRNIAYTKSSGTGDDKRTERVLETKTTYDTVHGLPTQVESLGDTGKTGDESCTKLEYLHHTGRNIIGLTKQTFISPTTCAAANFGDLRSLSSATRVAYDGTAFGTTLAATGRALATESWSLKGDGSGYQSNGTTAFDAIGRVVKNTDPDGRASTTTFEPATGQAFKTIERNTLGHQQIQEIDPGRATAHRTTDPNGHVSRAVFDPLGRVIEGWAPGREPGTGKTPDFKATYVTPVGKPPHVSTEMRGKGKRIEKSVTLYDGLGRERQVQTVASGGGRLITDTFYNSSGDVWRTNDAYLAEGTPQGELFTPLADSVIPNSTRYTHDGMGRVLEEMPVLNGVDHPKRAVRYEYGADHSTLINPEGGVAYKIYTDAQGRSQRVDTYTDADRKSFTSMRYQYDKDGQMILAENSAAPGVGWSWQYDQRGRMTFSSDPEAGTTRFTYDHLDRPLTTSNSRGITTWTGYDELSRPKESRLDGPTGKLLGQFTYDTVKGGKGLPATATRYTDGEAYTQSVNGYTDDYQPTATTLTLPKGLADQWGLKSSYSYSSVYGEDGEVEQTDLPAIGKLDAETLHVRYDEEGMPLSISGKDWYGAETVYSPHGQILRSTLGARPYRVWTQASYDEASGELKDQQVYREQTGDGSVVSGNLVSKRSYGYDDAGNVTSIREHATGIEERQCFAYDPLGQLRQAWTAKDQGACSGGPQSSTVAAGKDASGYWHEYSYDLLGNRLQKVEKDLGGDTKKDTTTDYTYGDGKGSAPRHLTKVTKQFVTPTGTQIKAEAERLYEKTGETKSITSLDNGDKQELTWTWDGQVERIIGEGSKGRTPYVGAAGKCLDLVAGGMAAGGLLQLYTCNGTPAQDWSFTPVPGQPDANLGTLNMHGTWCAVPTGNTAGSMFQIQKCNGSAAQQLQRHADGRISHPTSKMCLATKDAGTANSTRAVLAACSTTAPTQKWEPQRDTRYIYGPSGQKLLSITGNQATLSLGESEVTVQRGGVLVDSRRTYPAPGGAVMRYASGDGGSILVAMVGDHQGSQYAEVELNDNMRVRIRKQDPFGNERTAGTVGAQTQTKAGFLGAENGKASGFTQLGARLYDPEVGRFLSADPVLDLLDPMQSNGYAYAHNNPVTLADPTGLSVALTASELGAALAGMGLTAAQVAQAQVDANRSLSDVIMSVAWAVFKEFIGWNDMMACAGGDMWACGGLILDNVGVFKAIKIAGKIWGVVKRTMAAISAWKTAKAKAEQILKTAKQAEKLALEKKKKQLEEAKKKAAQEAKKKAAEAEKKATAAKAVDLKKKTGNPVQKKSQATSNSKASSQRETKGKSGGSKVNLSKGSAGGKSSGGAKATGGTSGASSRSNGGSSGSSGAGKSGETVAGCRVNSFVPGTLVLMADGTAVPIEEVEVGDQVLATNEATGETRVATVTAEIKGQGVKDLVRITLDGNAGGGAHDQAITSTSAHPFWVPELSKWVEAKDLRSGNWLRTSAGTHVQVGSVERWTVRNATVHNLTVGDTHTYYVIAGDAAVLVHNAGKSIIVADNPLLQNRIDGLFHGWGAPDAIGDGTSFAAANHEALGGEKVNGADHVASTRQIRGGLVKILGGAKMNMGKGVKNQVIELNDRDRQILTSLVAAIDDAHAGNYSDFRTYAGLDSCS
ncbi:polymorphic toxin-type HINT domain-containing protein [Streptomyces sp. BI20]|uniref:polymorphic toxin-type HINT domain-containing protein n=1 Tax=Streptomyces sp. BI20 TaxID=3403460 RepID=UPI003C76F9F4